jgi:alkaline phosphatase
MMIDFMGKCRGFKRWVLGVIFTVLLISIPCGASDGAKNVILLISDGCGAEQYTFARWFKGSPLSLDGIQVGSVKTYIADSVVADSAPAASAYATGARTFDKVISVGPERNAPVSPPASAEKEALRPLATILEGAKLTDRATGIVATSRVSHATPAAFAAHVTVRNRENDIMEQMVFQDIDVVFGGGRGRLLPKEEGGKRKDGENLVNDLIKKGVRFVKNADELAAVRSGRVFGIFSDSHMSAEIDRPELTPSQPTLKAMTAKAIEILSRDPDGFFLVVEGSQIDWACHANDPAHLVRDLLAYDEAVGVCLDFAKTTGNTLVMALSDHNTGGFSIGNYATSATYSQMKPDELLGPIKKMTASAMVLSKMTKKNETPENVVRVVKNGWGMDITLADGATILAMAKQYKAFGASHYAFGEILCPKYTSIGWSTHGHTGGDVPLFAYGPGKPAGVLDAPEVGRLCARVMGFDLDKVTRRLYQDAHAVLPEARITVDKTDAKNPVVRIVHGEKTFLLPVNRNQLIARDEITLLEAPVLLIETTGRVYISIQAVNLMTDAASPLPAIQANPS